jgi:hypothetical protein
MPKLYSMDLRERVAAYVEAGHSRRATAAHFSVSPSFVINLMTALRERGGLAPKLGTDTPNLNRIAITCCGGSTRRTTSPCRSWGRSFWRRAV